MDFSKEVEVFFDSYNLDENRSILTALNYVNQHILASEWDDIKEKSEILLTEIDSDKKLTNLESLFKEFQINSKEGFLLIGLAIALIQVPDYYTSIKLIEDKITQGDWSQHIGKNKSFIVNLSSLAMKLSGRYINIKETETVWSMLKKRIGSRLIYLIIKNIVRKTLESYRFGSSVKNLKLSRLTKKIKYSETNISLYKEDAQTFTESNENYLDIMESLNFLKTHNEYKDYLLTISFSLSSLYPFFEGMRVEDIINELCPKLESLLCAVKETPFTLSIEPYKNNQQDLIMSLLVSLFENENNLPLNKLTVTLQAYNTRVFDEIKLLKTLSKKTGFRMGLKLIKGEFWDKEILKSQKMGAESYSVFTRKESTDLMFLAVSHYLFNECYDNFNLTFGTHNAHTLKSIEMFSKSRHYKIEKVKGLGDRVFKNYKNPDNSDLVIYGPVGNQKDLSNYIKRRLLSKSSPTSFLQQLNAKDFNVKNTLSPWEKISRTKSIQNPEIPMPAFYDEYKQIRGIGKDINYRNVFIELLESVNSFAPRKYLVHSVIWGKGDYTGEKMKHFSSKKTDQELAEVIYLNDVYLVSDAIESSKDALKIWKKKPFKYRREMISNLAKFLDESSGQFVDLCMREGERDFKSSILEVRKAIDYCYIFSNVGDEIFKNENLSGVGVVACINDDTLGFSLIVKQIVAALLAGNSLIIKPSKNNVIITYCLLQLLYRSGVSSDLIQYLISFKRDFERELVMGSGINLVAFHGSEKKGNYLKELLIKSNKDPDKIVVNKVLNAVSIIDGTINVKKSVKSIIRNKNFTSNSDKVLSVVYVQDTIKEDFLLLLMGRLRTLSRNGKNEFNYEGYKKFEKYLTPREINKLNEIDILGVKVIFFKGKNIDNIIMTVNKMESNLSIYVQSNNQKLIKHIKNEVISQKFHINTPIEETLSGSFYKNGELKEMLEERDYLMKMCSYKIISY
jgi:RHH-type proline utilization regulon transcriptional repressor/proline dehydrogenase/delta 1-pyrroline-5-carboxylate dehydrogenase